MNSNTNKSNDDDDEESSNSPPPTNKPGWAGWRIQTFRQVGPELESQCGLKKLHFESTRSCRGKVVCFIHTDPKKPAIWHGTVLDFSNTSTKLNDGTKLKFQKVQVVPDDIKDPKTGKTLHSEGICWVDAVYEIPENEEAVAEKIEGIYRSRSKDLDEERRMLLED